MATVYSNSYQTGTYTTTRVKVDYSGTTATATLLYSRSNNYSGATGAGNPAYFYFGTSSSYGTGDISNVTFYGYQEDAVVGSCTFTISTSGGTYSGYTYNGGYVGGDTSWSSPAWTVTIPAQQPNTPTISASSASDTSNSITYGTTSFNTDSGTVYLYGGISSSPTTQIASKTTIGDSTYTHTGLTPNTKYYYRARANSSIGWSNYSSEVSAVTRAGLQSASISSFSASSITISYVTQAGGGEYTQNIQYSLNGGSTWTTGATVASGTTSSVSDTFVISGLSQGTTYNIMTRINTTSGAVSGPTLSQTTAVLPSGGSLTITGTTWDSVSVSGSLTDWGGPIVNNGCELKAGIRKVYNEAPRKEISLVYHDPTEFSGSGTISNSSDSIGGGFTICGCMAVYPYLWATNGTVDTWLIPSTSENVIYLPPAPLSVLSVESQVVSGNTTTITFKVQGAAADGTNNMMGAMVHTQYRAVINGVTGSWVRLDTNAEGPATIYSSSFTATAGVPVKIQAQQYINNAYSEIKEISFTASTGIDFSNFDFEDSDASVVAITGDNQVLVQSKSSPKLTIKVADRAVALDSGATITEYTASFLGQNRSIGYSSSSDVYTTFSVPTTTGVQTVSVTARDSYNSTKTVTKNVNIIAYGEPSITATITRINAVGNVRLDVNGEYSPVLVGGSATNNLILEYKAIRADGYETEWTQFLVSTNNSAYSGSVNISEVNYDNNWVISVRVTDSFGTLTQTEVSANMLEGLESLSPADYEIELWNWKSNSLVADISYLVIGPLSIEWVLNDVEEVSFDIDLLRFESKCEEMGVVSTDLLAPYAHDIRIKRNGVYILGCQLVEANIQLSNNPPAKIQVRGTGFLNLFKDQYIMNEAWSGYTYAQIARKLVEAAQKPDCLIKNPTIDIDTSYWLAGTGTIATTTNAHSGDSALVCSASSGAVVAGSQMTVDSGTLINIDGYVKATSGQTITIVERRYVTDSSSEMVIQTITADGTWQHMQSSDYQTMWEDGYICIGCSGNPVYVDDFYVYSSDDDASLCDMNVALGVDTASSGQDSTRQVNYELQNVKDALIELTSMEDDNFDFSFDPDRTFNVYSRKGSDKLDLDITYPGNVDSMTISRSAANLANKIIAIGSGIGDERLQVKIPNNTSRAVYGTRESVSTNSNISLKSSLLNKAIGDLYDKKDPTNLPRIKIKDGSINPALVQTGDAVVVDVKGVNYIESATGVYKINRIKLEVSEDAVEEMDLTVEPPVQRPDKKMVRYIRDSINGNSVNYSNHWVEVQALMLVGNEYVNVALNKAVYGNKTFVESGDRAVDGDISTYAEISESSRTRDAITIDLGEEYPIDYIRVWHYYDDGRTYYGDTLSVGTDLPDGTSGTENLEDVLWSYGDLEGYVETSEGRRSGWLQEQNVVNGES